MMSAEETFSFTNEHLALLRSAVVMWGSSESGAPYIARFAAPELVERVPGQEIERALQILLKFGELEPGRYSYENPLSASEEVNWRIDSNSEHGMPIHKEPQIDFDLTADHLRLLRGANARWPGIDSKRPYGDMSCFYLDMAVLLGVAPEGVGEECEGGFSKPQVERFDALHRSMIYAFQTFLKHAARPRGQFGRKPAGFGPWRSIPSDH